MARWQLDPAIDFLNHGSFGALPLEVAEVQRAWQARMEAEPVRFMVRTLPGALELARVRAARFVGADAAGLVFVPNATAGANAVLQSLDLEAGDEILCTNHGYNAVRQAISRVARRTGARAVVAQLPFPFTDPAELAEPVIAAMGDRTRLVVVDHITSPTAILLPVQAIIAAARERGIPVLVDAAHVPGQLDCRVEALGADFWTGNLHKWLCAPRGTALLAVSAPWRDRIHPTITSHGYGQGLHAEFDWTGTFDPTAWLAAPAAMDLHEDLGGPEFRVACHELVRQGRVEVAQALGQALPHPDDPSLYASMATIPLGLPQTCCLELMDRLLLGHGIEVPVVPFGGQAWVRISGFADYNRPEQYTRLAGALADLAPEFVPET